MFDPSASVRWIRLWDLPTRLFHWSLVVLVAVAWWSGEQGRMDVHFWCGYTLLTLIGFRILWGLVGSSTARFAEFLVGPRRVFAYLRQFYRPPSRPDVGHSPTGGWMIVIMLLVLLVQISTGLFARDDIFTDGPLAHWVSDEQSDFLTDWHKAQVNVLLGLIGLHVAAIVWYLIIRRENLIRRMITGYLRWPASDDPPSLQFAPLWLAVVLVAVNAAAVAALIAFA